MKIAILDDCLNELNEIKNYTQDYFNFIQQSIKIDTYLIPNESFFLKLRDYDFLILDVILNVKISNKDINGIDLARKIRLLNKDIKIVFCSSSNDYSIDAFDVKAFSYILKPIQRNEYYRKLDNLINDLKVNMIHVEDIQHICLSINISHINYIEVIQKKTCIHIINGKVYWVVKPLRFWQQSLSDKYFVIGYKVSAK